MLHLDIREATISCFPSQRSLNPPLNSISKWKGTVPVHWVNGGISPTVHGGAIRERSRRNSVLHRSVPSIRWICWDCLPIDGSVGRLKSLSWCWWAWWESPRNRSARVGSALRVRSPFSPMRASRRKLCLRMDDCSRRMLSLEVPLHKIATCFARNAKKEFRQRNPTNRSEHFLRIGMSQLGDPFVIVSYVVEIREFDVLGNDPSRWNHSFIALKPPSPNIDLPLRIEWS